jgi:hypothetical protein
MKATLPAILYVTGALILASTAAVLRQKEETETEARKKLGDPEPAAGQKGDVWAPPKAPTNLRIIAD